MMLTRQTVSRSKDITCFCVITLSGLAVAHYVFGIFLMLKLGGIVEQRMQFFAFCIPYIGIMLGFAVAAVFGYRRRLRFSLILFVFSLVASTGIFAYDLIHYRYQISGDGHGPGYAIWWWYDDPYWRGYKPGNV